MTIKADFNGDEWATVVSAPLYGGVAVSRADKGGALRESAAMQRVYLAARQRHGESRLLDELVKSPAMLDPDLINAAGGDILTVAERLLREAVQILEAKASNELDAYKIFVMTVAQSVAEAHKEGGFLGIGGTAVSDKENAALDRLSLALGTPPKGHGDV